MGLVCDLFSNKTNWVFFPLTFNFHCSHLYTKELLNICMIMGWVCYLCIFIEWIKLPELTFRIYFHFPTMIFIIYWASNCQAWISTHLIYTLLEGPLGVSYCYLHLRWNWVYSKAMKLASVQKGWCWYEEMMFPVLYRAVKREREILLAC